MVNIFETTNPDLQGKEMGRKTKRAPTLDDAMRVFAGVVQFEERAVQIDVQLQQAVNAAGLENSRIEPVLKKDGSGIYCYVIPPGNWDSDKMRDLKARLPEEKFHPTFVKFPFTDTGTEVKALRVEVAYFPKAGIKR